MYFYHIFIQSEKLYSMYKHDSGISLKFTVFYYYIPTTSIFLLEMLYIIFMWTNCISLLMIQMLEH